MRSLFLLLFASVASAAVIPVSGSFDPSWGDSREFHGTITIDDRSTGAVDLFIGSGSGELGLTQEPRFQLPLRNTSRIGSQDVAILQNRVDLDGDEVCNLWGCASPVAGAFIDIDAARGLYDDGGISDDDFRVLKISMYLYDSGDDFSGYWVFHRSAVSVPEPAMFIPLLLGGLLTMRRNRYGF